MTEVRNVVSSERERKRSLDTIEDIIQAKAHSLRNQLSDSVGCQATSKQLMEDLFDADCGDDDGEIMLLAMILLQLHGKLQPGELQDEINKKKRQRTSPDQLAILEQIFQTDRMPSQQTRVQLADQLGMSSRRVQIWFQNKRAKVKRGISKSSESIVIGEDDDIDSVPRNPLSVSTTINAPFSSIRLNISSPSSPGPSSPSMSSHPSSLPFRFIPPPGSSTSTTTTSTSTTSTPNTSDMFTFSNPTTTPSILQTSSSSILSRLSKTSNSNPLSLSSATVPFPSSPLTSSSSLSSLCSIAEEVSVSSPAVDAKFSVPSADEN